MAAAAVTVDDGLKRTVLEGKLEHLVIPGAGLQPDGRHAGSFGLLEHSNGDGRVRDDGHGRILGAGQGRDVGNGGVVLAVDGHGRRGGVDGGDLEIAVQIPGMHYPGLLAMALGNGIQPDATFVAKLGRVGACADNGEGRRAEKLARGSFGGHFDCENCGGYWETTIKMMGE